MSTFSRPEGFGPESAFLVSFQCEWVLDHSTSPGCVGPGCVGPGDPCRDLVSLQGPELRRHHGNEGKSKRSGSKDERSRKEKIRVEISGNFVRHIRRRVQGLQVKYAAVPALQANE